MGDIAGVRICWKCKITWQFFRPYVVDGVDSRDCPRCKIECFFTANSGDLGTAMMVTAANIDLDEFERVDWHDAIAKQDDKQ